MKSCTWQKDDRSSSRPLASDNCYKLVHGLDRKNRIGYNSTRSGDTDLVPRSMTHQCFPDRRLVRDQICLWICFKCLDNLKATPRARVTFSINLHADAHSKWTIFGMHIGRHNLRQSQQSL